MAPPTLSSTAASRETTATMTTTMATTVAPLATIESTGAAVVLLPHGAKPPRPSPAADSTSLSSPIGQAPSANVNAPKPVPSIATDAPPYTPSSSVEDGGTTASSDDGGERWDVGVLGAAANDGMLAIWGHGQGLKFYALQKEKSHGVWGAGCDVNLECNPHAIIYFLLI